MTGFGEIDQNVRFWAKMAIFFTVLTRKWQKRDFWEKAKMSLP